MPEASATGPVPRDRRITNDLEIRQVGMSRSGNHALQNWILHQVQGRACLLNCAEPRTNPYISARPLDEHGRVSWASYPRFELAAEQAGELTCKDVLLYSHEDCFLGMLSRGEPFEGHHDEWIGRSRRRVDVLLLRDPFNLFASRLRHAADYGHALRSMRIWKQHAREFLGLRRHLRNDSVRVNYNRWASSRAYRREVAEALELEFDDGARRYVPSVGEGSSFDGRAYDGRAEIMPVLDRWQWFRRHPELLGIFDAAALDLAERIFGRELCDPFRGLMKDARSCSGRSRSRLST